ncbi:MAG: hypothetical protein Q9219_001796 [cf. Caloplaca sp. 3 TL-2023]
MPNQRVVEDSDEDGDIGDSPVRLSKPAIGEASSSSSTGQDSTPCPRLHAFSTDLTDMWLTEVPVGDAHNILLHPSTSLPSGYSQASSDSTSGAERFATIAPGTEGPKRPKITYGAKEGRGRPRVNQPRNNNEVMSVRKQARIYTDMGDDDNEVQDDAEDRIAGDYSFDRESRRRSSVSSSTSDMAFNTSMHPPMSKPPTSSEQSTQSGRNKRAVSELESPRMILGEEVPFSSSAPAESPTKRIRVDPTNQDLKSSSSRSSHKGHAELSLPMSSPAKRRTKQAEPRKNSSQSSITYKRQVEDPELDDLMADLPKENYQPRPSRSRSALAADDLVIPEDFSKRPEVLARSTKKAPRKKTTILEDSNQAIDPIVTHKKSPGPSGYPEDITTISNKPVEEPPPVSPQVRKSRGRPKKETAPVEQCSAPVQSAKISADTNDSHVSSVSFQEPDPSPAPTKKGRKRKKPKSAETELELQNEQLQALDHQKDELVEPAFGAALADSDPNIQPSLKNEEPLEDTKVTAIKTGSNDLETPKNAASKLAGEDRSAPDLGGKGMQVKCSSSPVKQEVKSVHRVGLSKKHRIPSLLRVVRK